MPHFNFSTQLKSQLDGECLFQKISSPVAVQSIILIYVNNICKIDKIRNGLFSLKNQ